MTVSQKLIDEGHAFDACDLCGGRTLSDGAVWHANTGRHIEVCASCAIRIGGSLIADSIPTAEPADVVRVLGEVTRRIWQCARLRTERERLQVESAAHGR